MIQKKIWKGKTIDKEGEKVQEEEGPSLSQPVSSEVPPVQDDAAENILSLTIVNGKFTKTKQG